MKSKKIGCMIVLLLIFCISNVAAEPCGDVNSDGAIDIVDALLIAQFYVGVIPELPGCDETPIPTPTPTPTPDSGPVTYELQAEDETWSSGGVDSNHDEYTGSGFVSTDNASGEWIEWSFNLSADSTATCEFRYASGGGARPMTLTINNTNAGDLAFSGSNAWNDWQVDTAADLSLSAGAVAIRVTATGSGGAPNMDKMDITLTGGEIVAPTATPEPTPTPTCDGSCPPTPDPRLYKARVIIDDDITIPEDATLKFLKGGIFDLGNGVTVTIEGSIEAGPFQIFDTSAGNAKVDFGNGLVNEVYPEWWGVHCSSGSDDQPAFQAAVDSGASVIRALDRHYYFDSPLKISQGPIRLLGSTMTSGTEIEGNSGFSVGGNDAEALIVLDDGVDYVEIAYLTLWGGTTEVQYVDYGIYAEGDKTSVEEKKKSHQEIHIHHLWISRMVEWGIRIACHLSNLEHIRVTGSNGIWIGRHDATNSPESTNITLKNCYVNQGSQSTARNGYRMDYVSGFTAMGCAADHCNIIWDNNYSIGQIIGSDGEGNRQVLKQRGPASNTIMSGCRWYDTGDKNSNYDQAIFDYKGRLSIKNTYVQLDSQPNGGLTYQYFFKELSNAHQLALEGLYVRFEGIGEVDPINDTVHCPSDFDEGSEHLHPERDPAALMILAPSSFQHVPSDTATKVAFNSVVYDLQGNSDTSNYEYDIIDACRGIYEFEAQVTLYNFPADKIGTIMIYENPSNPTLIGQATVTNAVSSDMVLQIRATHTATDTQSYYVVVQHNDSSSRYIRGGKAYTYFRTRRIAPNVGI